MPNPNIQLHKLSKRFLPMFLLLLPSLGMAVAPIEANFILGMDVQEQRLNLYKDCQEGSVTCDNMLLVAPDLGRLLQKKQCDKKLNKSPYAVKLYSAKTKHSLCKDGVTPCGFQGYSFEGEDFNGFIDPANNDIYIDSNWTVDGDTLSYKENSTYLPLASQAGLINDRYGTSDKELNDIYRVIRHEVRRLYGEDMETDLKKDPIKWLVERSKDCGADSRHLPRTQAEKVYFIQKNNARMQEYFLWID